MYCPSCNIEYRSGFSVCSDCGTTLQDGAPLHSSAAQSSPQRVPITISQRTLFRVVLLYGCIATLAVAQGAVALFLKPLSIPFPWESRLNEPLIAFLVLFGRFLPFVLLVHMAIVVSLAASSWRALRFEGATVHAVRALLLLEGLWQALMLLYRPLFTFNKPYLDPMGRPAVIPSGLHLMLSLSAMSVVILAGALFIRSRLALSPSEDHRGTAA